MPINVEILAVQAGDIGTVGTVPGIYVLGVADARLIGGSSLQWLRFSIAPMFGMEPTSGQYAVTVTIDSVPYTTASLDWYASPWTVAKAITLAVADYNLACVPIDIDSHSSATTILYEFRDPDFTTITQVDISPGTLNGMLTTSITQARSGTLPSQAGNMGFASEFNPGGGTVDTAGKSNEFNLTDNPTQATAISNAMAELFGSIEPQPAATIYASHPNADWYVIELQGNLRVDLLTLIAHGITAPEAPDVEIWEVQKTDGEIGLPEVQTIEITDPVNAGTFTLTAIDNITPGGPNSVTSDPIAWNATAEEVRTALRFGGFNQDRPLLHGVMVNTSGGPLPSTPVRIVFSPLDGDVPLMTADTSGLSYDVPVVEPAIRSRSAGQLVTRLEVPAERTRSAQSLASSLQSASRTRTANALTDVLQPAVRTRSAGQLVSRIEVPAERTRSASSLIVRLSASATRTRTAGQLVPRVPRWIRFNVFSAAKGGRVG